MHPLLALVGEDLARRCRKCLPGVARQVRVVPVQAFPRMDDARIGAVALGNDALRVVDPRTAAELAQLRQLRLVLCPSGLNSDDLVPWLAATGELPVPPERLAPVLKDVLRTLTGVSVPRAEYLDRVGVSATALDDQGLLLLDAFDQIPRKTVAEWASALGTDRHWLRRHSLRSVGVAPADVLCAWKVAAAELLARDGCSMEEIARRLDYSRGDAARRALKAHRARLLRKFCRASLG